MSESSKLTAEREPQIETKYSAYAGKLYRVQGCQVWMSTKEAARDIYEKQLDIQNAQS